MTLVHVHLSFFRQNGMVTKWHPFKIKITYELTEDDSNRRIKFCNKMMCKYDNDNIFFNYIIFSDDVSFQLNRA